MYLREAFDSVNRDVLWRILAHREMPPKFVNLIFCLYSGTKSAVMCDYFPVNTGVREGGVLAQTLFDISMDHVLGRMSEESGCGLSFATVRVTDLDFADDAVIFAQTTEIVAGALDSLSEEAEPLRLRVSWIKTEVQAFGDILDATVESIPVNGENVEVTQTFICLGSVFY